MEALQPVHLPAGQAVDLAAMAGFCPSPSPTRRICLLGYRSHPYTGGQGIYLHYLSSALADRGHQVDVISGQPYPHLDPRVRLIKMPGMNLYETGLLSLRWHHLLSSADRLEWFSKLTGGFAEPEAFGRRVVAYLREHGAKYDIVHDNQSLSYGLLELQNLGIPLVSTIHHPITSDLSLALSGAKSWWRRLLVRRWHAFLRMQRHVAPRLDHIITVSKCARADIARAFSMEPDRIRVVANGIDADVFAPIEALSREPLRLMTTASADQPLKGLRYLLKAMDLLQEDFPTLELLVIGRLSEKSPTRKLLKRLKLGSRVRFMNGISTEELVRQYAQATLAVVPSLYEGFGLPAVEAMACGVPLVCSDGGALPEVIGDAAVRVPAGDSKALARAIGRLLGDEGARIALGERGRTRMLTRFCWRRAAEQMSEYYETVITADANR